MNDTLNKLATATTTLAPHLLTATWSALIGQRNVSTTLTSSLNQSNPFWNPDIRSFSTNSLNMASKDSYISASSNPYDSITSSISTFADPLKIDAVAAAAEEVERDDLIENEFVQIFFCILYSTVFVLGVFGNVLVCYVVLRNRAMQTVTNIFITNLALSDILLCILGVPFTPLYTFMGRWAFGKTLCHLVSFAQGCSIYISTLTLTSIAIDRYFVIIYPFHPRMKLSTCIAIIVSIWVISLLATLPYGMYMKVVMGDVVRGNVTVADSLNITATVETTTAAAAAAYLPLAQRNYDAHMQIVATTATGVASATSSVGSHIYNTTNEALIAAVNNSSKPPPCYCEENWPSEHYRKVFGSVTTILQFVLPFFIISICYIWISVKLNARARAKPGSKSSRKEEADRDRKKRTNRMLIAMVGVFGLSWLPLNVVNMSDDFYEKSNEWKYYTLFFFVAHSIAMSSTCYNPFLYAWLNENFRKEFKHVLPCFNPSNNNIISLTRGYNRSDRNTCGPRLHHKDGRDAGCNNGTNTRGSSLDNDDQDDNAITQDTCLSKSNFLIIPREPTYGNGHTALSPCLERSALGVTGVNAALVQCSKQVEILLNDSDIYKQNNHKQHHGNHGYSQYSRQLNDDDDGDLDSYDEQTIEMRLNDTPFISSDNATGISIMETSTSNDAERSATSSERDHRLN